MEARTMDVAPEAVQAAVTQAATAGWRVVLAFPLYGTVVDGIFTATIVRILFTK